MSRQTLLDNHFQAIGYIETDRDGKQRLLDRHFHFRGYFEPKTNKTFNEHFQLVGTGNLLTTLLHG